MNRPLFHRVYDAGHLIEEVPFCDPLSVFAAVAGEPFALLLDSATAAPQRDPTLQGRWTYIATDPFTTLSKSAGQTFLNGIPQNIAALELLSQQSAALALAPDWPDEDGLPPFTGGFAGLFGYALGQELEKLPTPPQQPGDTATTPDIALGAYDCVLAFDCVDRRAFIVSTGLPEASPTARAVRAEARAAKWRARLALNPALPELEWPETPAPENTVRVEQNREAYEQKVQQVIDYIYAGDIFQANLSQRFDATLQNGDDAFTLYRKLRAISPAPFAGFFNFEDGSLLSSSPERFLRSDGRNVETKPIKGTRPRGATAAEDKDLAQELINSEKDHAENVMIVDLLRNDLSRVSEDASVKVTRLCELESFATVHHLVSTVESTLKPDSTNVDLLKACFPGGSITGAPKVRAMEIISELESTTRGPYCGSLGYLSFSGTMDTNILIRSMTCMGEHISFRAGGGIVADSKPAYEYQETLDKAAALAEAVRGVVRNDAAETAKLIECKPDAIILSPGPCTPAEAGISKDLIRAAAEHNLPLLGVCLGHQCIAEVFGGKTVRAAAPRHGKTSMIKHGNHPLFAHLPNPFAAARYHSLVSDVGTAGTLNTIAQATDDGHVMALAHESLPIFGVQFHPESVLTDHGHQLLANFLDLSGIPHGAVPQQADMSA
eukprot:s1_g373.t1